MSEELFFKVSSGVNEGLLYSFRLRAKNQLGWGPYSEIVQTIPCTNPAKMTPVTMTIENIYVKVSWTLPPANGAQITNYRVLILANDQMTWQESVQCDSADPVLVSDLECFVPMEELTGPRFSLGYNQFIKAKVQARNYRGWSELSNTNTVGVYSEVVPQAVG